MSFCRLPPRLLASLVGSRLWLLYLNCVEFDDIPPTSTKNNSSPQLRNPELIKKTKHPSKVDFYWVPKWASCLDFLGGKINSSSHTHTHTHTHTPEDLSRNLTRKTCCLSPGFPPLSALQQIIKEMKHFPLIRELGQHSKFWG